MAAGLASERTRGGADEDETGQAEGQDEKNASPLGLSGDGGSDKQDNRSLSHPTANAFARSWCLRAALSGAGTALAIGNRNLRSPGFRVVGLRRADALTGGPISVRSAFLGVLFDQARQAATKPLFRARAQRGRDRLAELAPKLREIEHEYEADPEARERAVVEFYKANEVNPFDGCGWLFAGPLMSQLLLTTTIRNGVTAHDRLTRTIVVSDR